MYHYPHHISDFNNSTRHLTRLERSVYRDAIERYYEIEHPLPTDDFFALARKLCCTTDAEKDALKSVLAEFFVENDGYYHHSRCDQEIQKYRANTSAKARAGKASAAARGKGKRKPKKHNPTHVEHMLNTCTTDEQLTKNQEPRTKNHLRERETQASQPESAPTKPTDIRSKRKKPATQLPEDFVVTLDMVNWAQENKLGHINLMEETDRFRDHWKSKGEPRADWIATWRNWIRRADGYQRQTPGGPGRSSRSLSLQEMLTDTSWAN